jgi:ADP-ribose pyrophosphatase YjhB (NUDIX family)
VGKNTQSLRQFSSGGVVYRGGEWLVARNNPSKLYPNEIWRLQKGWIDDAPEDAPGPMTSGRVKADEESQEKAATREVREEGGVIAKIIKKIGTSKYFMNLPSGRVMKFVTFYLMEYQKDAPEGFGFETVETLWLPFNEAYRKLTFSNEKEMLTKAQKLLASVV